MGSSIRELRLDEGNQLDKPLVEAIFPLVYQNGYHQE